MSVPLYSDRQKRATLSDLVRELLQKVSELISTEIRLVKTEIRVESRKLARAVLFALTALLIGFFFILFLGLSLILLFAQVVDWVWASVITTGIYLAAAGLAALMALKEIQKNSATIDV